MTMMNAAARGAVVAQELAYDLRHMEGAATAEAAAIYALPGGAAPVALLQMFREAARQKQDEEAIVQIDRAAHVQQQVQDADDQQQQQQQQEIQHYRETIGNLLKENDRLTRQGDDLLQRLENQHAKTEIILADGKEAVLSDDGKTVLDASTGNEFFDARDKKEAEDKVEDRRQKGQGIEHISDHESFETAKNGHINAQDQSAEANANADADPSKMTSEERSATITKTQKANGDLAASNQKMSDASAVLSKVSENKNNSTASDLGATPFASNLNPTSSMPAQSAPRL